MTSRPTAFFTAVLVLLLTVAPAIAQESELPPGGTFFDDDGSVHEGAIEALVAEGITKGCSTEPAFYCPKEAVTRAQMAAFLQRAFQIPDAVGEDAFTDDTGSPFEPAINAVAEAGIARGCDAEARLFCPNQPVSRQEMASFLVRALVEGEFDPAPDAFTDDEGSPHEPDIDRLAVMGVTAGCGEGLFCPWDAVTREQMASFLTRGLGLEQRVPPPRPAPTLVSSFTTHHNCCEARVTNIHVIADQVDGAVVYPGQTFSVNQYVGPRTREKGYVDAPILLDGETYCCGVGGGVSQFATTLYNAVFWGGYEIIDHKPHSRYIDRYPLGIEATLGYPNIDLVFRNDTDTPLEIRTSYTGTSITVEIWGDDMGRTVSAEVTGSATYSSGGTVKVVRTITEADGSVRSQTWFWTYLGS